MKAERPAIQPELFTLAEAAIILGRSIPTVRNLIYSGDLAVCRSNQKGKQWLSRREIEKFIAEHTVRHIPPPAKGVGA